MAKGICKLLIKVTFKSTGEQKEVEYHKKYPTGPWSICSDIEKASDGNDINHFLSVSAQRFASRRDKTDGTSITEIVGFASSTGIARVNELYKYELEGKTPYCVFLKDPRNKLVRLVTTKTKTAKEMVAIGTDETGDSVVPLILVKVDDKYKEINRY